MLKASLHYSWQFDKPLKGL